MTPGVLWPPLAPNGLVPLLTGAGSLPTRKAAV